MESAENTFPGKQVPPIAFRPMPGDESLLLDELNRIIREKQVYTLFQPIFDLRSNRIYGYEALSRGPETSPLHMPDLLFRTACQHNRLFALECICRESAIKRFMHLQLRGHERLFLNLDPSALLDPAFREGTTMQLLDQAGLPCSRVVIELTEHTQIENMGALNQAISHYRNMGFSIALDDLSAGYSNLQLMMELRPEHIKLDIYFTRKLPGDPVARAFVNTIARLAMEINCSVLAEGIETPEILCEVKKLGLDLAQGYLLGRPSPHAVNMPARALQDTEPHPALSINKPHTCVSSLIRKVTPSDPAEPSENVLDMFQHDNQLLAVPIVEHGRAIGMVLREEMLKSFSIRFARELHGRKPISHLMWKNPLRVSSDTAIDELSSLVTNRPFSYLYTPVIVENNQNYAGLVFVHDILEHITQSRIEQAMNANPLTHLPGNIAIEREVKRRLETGESFVLCYIDLDNFKAFNDRYGYKHGDAMIRLMAEIMRQISSASDFIGHIGGDDFTFILARDNAWENRIQQLMKAFEEKALSLYDMEDVKNGHITSKSRAGETQEFPLASVSIGAVPCLPGYFSSHLEASEAASELKCKAKETPGNCLEIDQRIYHVNETDH